jgi:hypothetical protein
MSDLLLGILVIGVLSALLLVGMLRISRTLSHRTSNLLAIFIVALMLANALFLTDSVFLTRVLPFSNLIVIGNWSPLLVAAFAGLIWWRVPPPAFRRIFIIGALTAACLVAIYRPILAAPPSLGDVWRRGVCRQTSQASCSAAAAATLLAQYGIKTNEAEMASLCLTSNRGTSLHGIWRGLNLKTAGSGMDVYMFNDGNIDDLYGAGPVMMSVMLEDASSVDPRYTRNWGWIPGVAHTVVFLGMTPEGGFLIGDPATGREVWSRHDLEILWHGVGVRLVRTGGAENDS